MNYKQIRKYFLNDESIKKVKINKYQGEMIIFHSNNNLFNESIITIKNRSFKIAFTNQFKTILKEI